jgi:hypothetical protein
VRLLTHHLDRAEQHAVDLAGRDAAPAEKLLQYGHRQVVGANVPKDAPARVGPAERAPNVSDEDGVPDLRHDRDAYRSAFVRGKPR